MGSLSVEVIWFLVGIAFFVCEMVVPFFVICFFGVGAWVTALVLLFLPMSLNMQLVVFLASSLLNLFLLRKYITRIFIGERKADEVDSALAFEGEEVVVIETIDPPAQGKVKYSGTNWKARADEKIEKGEVVTILSQDGLQMKVQKIQ